MSVTQKALKKSCFNPNKFGKPMAAVCKMVAIYQVCTFKGMFVNVLSLNNRSVPQNICHRLKQATFTHFYSDG